jgi:hypothetical protein
MKIKTSFIPNSSSSSFIVIDAFDGYKELHCDENLIVNSDFGETEFGWGPDVIKDIGSRIIFSYLQTYYGNNKKWLDMLESVIKENSNVKTIEWKIIYDCNDNNLVWSYIDHQSSAEEGINIEMFENKNNLKDFIFGRGSKIVLDNDNRG